MSNPILKIDQIYIQMPDNLFVSVNGVEQTWSMNSVNTIRVFGRDNTDVINVEATRAGKTLEIRGGAGGNYVYLSSGLKNLLHIQGNIFVQEDGGNTRVYFNDDNNTSPRDFTVSARDVRFGGSPASINFGGYANTASNTNRLILRGGSGGNTFTVDNQLAAQTFTDIRAGKGNDTVLVPSLGARGAEIDGWGGPIKLRLAPGSTVVCATSRGSFLVGNSGGWTNLTYDDSGDSQRSGNVRIYNDRVTGLGQSTMRYHPAVPGGIKTLTILARNSNALQGNTITVVSTPQNRAKDLVVNLSAGSRNDKVNVQGTGSRLNINGQAGDDTVIVGTTGNLDGMYGTVSVDSTSGTTTLFIDNSLDKSARNLSVSNQSVQLSAAQVFFNEMRLRKLAVFCGSGATTATVYGTPQNAAGNLESYLYFGSGVDVVNVLGTSGALSIDGKGGLDKVNIGADGRVDQIAGSIDISNPPLTGRISIRLMSLILRKMVCGISLLLSTPDWVRIPSVSTGYRRLLESMVKTGLIS